MKEWKEKGGRRESRGEKKAEGRRQRGTGVKERREKKAQKIRCREMKE